MLHFSFAVARKTNILGAAGKVKPKSCRATPESAKLPQARQNGGESSQGAAGKKGTLRFSADSRAVW